MSVYGFGKKTTTALAAVIAILAGFLFLSEGSAHARSSYLTSFNSTYGTSGTALNTCSLCHPGGNTGSLNSYATAYSSAGHSFTSIEAQDSDGDGFSNRTEIDARTFPGSAASMPAPMPPPPPPPPPGDTTPPTVVSTAPADGAASVPATTSLTVTFSEPVKSLDASMFTLTSGNIPVAGTVTLSASGTTATFQPSASLAQAATYLATITTGVTDLAGNPIVQPRSWSFTTAAAGIIDADGDGVPDIMDGFPNDNRKVTVTDPKSGDNITIDISSNAGTRLMSAAAIADSDPLLNQAGKPAGYEFRHGVETFRMAGLVPGSTANVVLSFQEPIQANAKVFKVDGAGFHEFPHAVINGNTVTLTLTDGGAGDADGAANGVIDDPVAVGTPVAASTPVPADSSSGGGGCSVAGTNGSGGFAGSLVFLALAALALRARKRSSGKR